MQTRPFSHGADLFVEDGEFTLIRVEVDSRAAPVQSILEAALAELRTARNAHREAAAALERASVERKESRKELYNTVRGSAMVVQNQNGGKRKCPAYVGLYPNGYGVLRTLDHETALVYTETLATGLTRNADPLIQAQGALLAAAVAAYRGTLEGYRNAWIARHSTFGLLQIGKLTWMGEYKRVQRGLLDLFRGNPDEVEKFFRTVRKIVRKKREQEPAQEDEGAGKAVVEAPTV